MLPLLSRGGVPNRVHDRGPRPDSCLDERSAARVSGLASGLALAVRPAGSAEVSGAQGWVLKIVSAERSETLFGCPLTLEGPTRTMRGVPVLGPVTSLPATGELGVTLTAWPWCWRAQSWRCTAGTACGRSPGCRARPAAASVGLASEGSERSGPPRTASPRLNPAAYGGSPWPVFPLDCSRPSVAAHG